MTVARAYFSSYRKEEMEFQIEMGNKSKCTPVGRGIVIFQRESGKKTSFTDVFTHARDELEPDLSIDVARKRI